MVVIIILTDNVTGQIASDLRYGSKSLYNSGNGMKK